MQAISNQSQLERVLRITFPACKIVTNIKNSILKNPKTEHNLEFDIWIPELNLAFEFQDVYHYATTWYAHQPLSVIVNQDLCKRTLAHTHGITLITIPYWWNSDNQSLLSTIEFQRPDLVQNKVSTLDTNSLIPLNVPHLSEIVSGQQEPLDCSSSIITAIKSPKAPLIVGNVERECILQSSNGIPSSVNSINTNGHSPKTIENIFTPPESSTHLNVMLASLASPHIISKEWWLGEKYDGVRFVCRPLFGLVNGRTGISLALPPNMQRLAQTVSYPIDGEIWLGRGNYNQLQELLFSASHRRELWPYTRGIIFDTIESKPMEHRYSEVLSLFDCGQFATLFEVASRILTKGTPHVENNLALLLADGAEGIILQKVNSQYQPGRSSSLIKIKTSQSESEALVLQIAHKSLQLQMPNGVVIWAPLDPHYRIAAGAVVTISYEVYSRSSIPVHPTIVRVRKDLVWQHVLQDSHDGTHPSLNDKEGYKFQAPRDYWNPHTMRRFLEDFARKRNMDPLVSETWYTTLRSHFSEEKWPFNFQNSGYVSTVIKLFPELRLDLSRFRSVSSGRWKDIHNRKLFFDQYTSSVGIDPLVPSSWNFIESSSFNGTMRYLLQKYYKGSFAEAITHLYPSLQKDVQSQPEPYAKELPIQRIPRRLFRRAFDRFAHQRRFNPLIPNNWYKIPIQDLLALTSIASMVKKAKTGIRSALVAAYPNIGLHVEKMTSTQYLRKWNHKQGRKHFFDNFAVKRGFDPLIPENWYGVTREDILKQPSAGAVLSYYQSPNPIVSALVEVYHDIGLTTNKFKYLRFL